MIIKQKLARTLVFIHNASSIHPFIHPFVFTFPINLITRSKRHESQGRNNDERGNPFTWKGTSMILTRSLHDFSPHSDVSLLRIE